MLILAVDEERMMPCRVRMISVLTLGVSGTADEKSGIGSKPFLRGKFKL